MLVLVWYFTTVHARTLIMVWMVVGALVLLLEKITLRRGVGCKSAF